MTGFATKETPELEDVPNIADQVRKLAPKRKASPQKPRILKDSKSSKSESPKKEVVDTTNNNDPGRTGRNQGGGDREFPFIPEAAPEFNPSGELSFVIVSCLNERATLA